VGQKKRFVREASREKERELRTNEFSSGKRGDFFKDFIETMAEEISRLRDYLNKNENN